MKHGADQPAEISEAPPTDEPPLRPPGEPPTRRNGRRAWLVPVGIGLGTSAVVTGLSYGMPDKYAATAVGLGFLAATYWVALRRDHPLAPDHYGLALGGLLDPEPISPRRVAATPLALWPGPLASRWPSFPSSGSPTGGGGNPDTRSNPAACRRSGTTCSVSCW